MEILENKVKQGEAVNKEMAEKHEDLERRFQQMKDQLQKTQREKDQIQIQLNNKIDILQYKLINGANQDAGLRDSQNISGVASAETTFAELLQLCKGDLNEITAKLELTVKNEQTED
mmetsp:Transcript_12522/g.21081  ORF Transcript_12522/g.21081 Transcript_12522/m.21081 type:complete len:117 (+) Transcript_12522:2223-2573(+)